VLPYGKDCVVIAPVSVRDRLIDKLKLVLENYMTADQGKS